MKNSAENLNLKRKFSREHAQGLRDQTAREIRRIRSLPVTSKDAPAEISASYKLKEIYEELQTNIFWRIFERSYYKDLEQLFQTEAKETKRELIRNAQKDFEKKLESILAECPLTPEERESYLSEEAMASMNLEDYLMLLQRLSGNYVAHITRQGVREKSFGMTEYGQLGQAEFHNNFFGILEGRKIHSFLTNAISQDPHLDSHIMSYFKDIKTANPDANFDELFEMLWMRLNESETASHSKQMGASFHFPAELSSAHFSVNSIESEMYGSERGYDIYFYYPAEFIAYNYYHQTKGAHDSSEELLTKPQRHGYSDVFVWNRGFGVPVRAALVCIPRDVQVDRKTGSQYQLDTNNKPILRDGKLIKAEDTISSEEYWEAYFNERPELRPNKIIYYHFPFETFSRSAPDSSLITQKAFKKIEQLPEYEKYTKEMKNRLKDKLRRILSSQ